MRIVVVGHSSQTLAPLAAELADYDASWRVRPVPDPHAAIATVANDGADVVVAGLQDGSGPALFEALRGSHPQVTRLLLLDVHEHVVPLGTLESAHRLLDRPLQGDQLIDAVESLVQLRELFGDAALHSVAGQVEPLTARAKSNPELLCALDDPGSAPAQIARLIAKDPVLAAKVLRLCNSACFCGGRAVTDLRCAVLRLGTPTLRRLVMANEVLSLASNEDAERDPIRRRARVAAQLASRLLGGSCAELAATASLLSEVGRLLPSTRAGGAEPHYAATGAYLLGLWGLPMAIVEGVAHHHQPQRSRTRGFWVSGAVHVARALAANEPVDEDYLASVSMLDRLPRWRAMAEELAEAC
ncbi:MAG TPA: HDOD domain-containing protein [Lysobacter sp.]|nr:HDOD domain-containing protein [Lysobacter sp.]